MGNLTGITEPGWHVITDPKSGATRRLDGELLKEILAEVSDYGVQHLSQEEYH